MVRKKSAIIGCAFSLSGGTCRLPGLWELISIKFYHCFQGVANHTIKSYLLRLLHLTQSIKVYIYIFMNTVIKGNPRSAFQLYTRIPQRLHKMARNRLLKSFRVGNVCVVHSCQRWEMQRLRLRVITNFYQSYTHARDAIAIIYLGSEYLTQAHIHMHII